MNEVLDDKFLQQSANHYNRIHFIILMPLLARRGDFMKKRLRALLTAAMACALMMTGFSLPSGVQAAQPAGLTTLGAVTEVR